VNVFKDDTIGVRCWELGCLSFCL